jgi:hypothetical protein
MRKHVGTFGSRCRAHACRWPLQATRWWGRNAVDGETLREVLRHARELPGAAEITAMETAALSGAGEGTTRSEVRTLAVTAIAQLGQIAQKLARLEALIGGGFAGIRS